MPYQNSTGGSFLKVGCNTESETIWINASYYFTLKSICLSCTFNRYFTNKCFYIVMYWSCRKYWFIESGSSFKCWHISLYSIKKKNVLISWGISPKNAFKLWEAVKTRVTDTSFLKFSFFLPESLNFIFGNKILSAVFLKVTDSNAHFQEKDCQI